MPSRVFLVSYCTDKDMEYLKSILNPADVLVGVDQGAEALLQNGLNPDFIIGDFDSFFRDNVPAPTMNVGEDKCITIRLNPDKDESDLEHAVRYFLREEDVSVAPISDRLVEREIVILNNLQGRIDHILSVIYLLELQNKNNIYISNAEQEIYLTTGYFQKDVPLDTTISLIPISEEVKNISTLGLLYRLDHETLFRNNSRGLSNKSVDKKIEINFDVGKLLVIISSGNLRLPHRRM